MKKKTKKFLKLQIRALQIEVKMLWEAVHRHDDSIDELKAPPVEEARKGWESFIDILNEVADETPEGWNGNGGVFGYYRTHPKERAEAVKRFHARVLEGCLSEDEAYRRIEEAENNFYSKGGVGEDLLLDTLGME